MRPKTPHLALLTFAVLASSAWSQKDRTAGLGRITWGPVDLEALTNGDDQQLGVQYVAGRYFVSSRAENVHGPGQKAVYEYTPTPQGAILTNQFYQSFGAQLTTWGYRDGMSDGTSLAFGYEDGVEFLDLQGQPVSTFDGVAVPLVWNPTAYLNPVWRALAYDPAAKSVFAGDLQHDVYEIDLATGNLLNRWSSPAAPNDWAPYGLALDPRSDANDAYLWMNSAPDGGDIALYRLPRHAPGTTPVLVAARTIQRVVQPSFAGGLTEVPGGGNLDPLQPNSHFDVAALDQGAIDVLTTYRVNLYAPLAGTEEPVLLARTNALDPLTPNSPQALYDGDTATWQFDTSQGFTNAVCSVWVNFSFPPVFDEAGPDGSAVFADPSCELRCLWLGSVPLGLAVQEYPPATMTGTGSLGPVPIGVLRVGDLVRIQGLYIDPQFRNPTFPFMATNQIKFAATGRTRPTKRTTPLGVTFSAEGQSSFTNDPSAGFWACTYTGIGGGEPAIEALVLTWDGSTVAGQSTMVFDPDQVGMGDTFLGGNSQRPGCQGTFRNGSDVLANLDYAPTPPAPCDAAARRGSLVSPDERTIAFSFGGFTTGTTFEFDLDTDQGIGDTGADMEGLIVTVFFADGTYACGELVRDPVNPLRASVGL
ncbi:MAG: hypothetical protein H6834_06645 [Planctomycetes bacterium]|nr:hypothetical protein [Planctomycetota bacterium]MCB9891804.1 hypothetical protein [Planctomycetota bacterium]